MATRNYGKRECMQCGKIFEAQYPPQITCSRECQRARNLQLAQERWGKYRMNLKQLHAELEEVKKANETLSDLLEATQNELKTTMQELEKFKAKAGKKAA